MTPARLAGLVSALALIASPPSARAQDPATDRPVGEIETVATSGGPMPTGATVSRTGRIVVGFPGWGDEVVFTVAKVGDGKPVADPDPATKADSARGRAAGTGQGERRTPATGGPARVPSLGAGLSSPEGPGGGAGPSGGAAERPPGEIPSAEEASWQRPE